MKTINIRYVIIDTLTDIVIDLCNEEKKIQDKDYRYFLSLSKTRKNKLKLLKELIKKEP